LNATGRSGESPALAGDEALRQLAARIAEEGPPLTVVGEPPTVGPAFGRLAAAGPRTAANPGRYAFVVEAVREGYLCHYETSRVLDDPDPDLALLAGDLFYAIGISALSELDDIESVRLLSDLIGVSAELRSGGRRIEAESMWIAGVMALSCGSDAEYEQQRQALARGEGGALEVLASWSQRCGNTNGLSRNLREARKAIDCASGT
jgi:hypothetical protein